MSAKNASESPEQRFNPLFSWLESTRETLEDTCSHGHLLLEKRDSDSQSLLPPMFNHALDPARTIDSGRLKTGHDASSSKTTLKAVAECGCSDQSDESERYVPLPLLPTRSPYRIPGG